MRRLIHTVLVGALVLVAAFGQAQTRESLELQPSAPNDQLQPDSNEKFKAVSVEIHEKTLDAQISTKTQSLLASTTPDVLDSSKEKVDSPKTDTSSPLSNVKVNSTTHSEDPGDVSLELSSLERKNQVIVSVDPAAQAVNETASSDEADTTTQGTKTVSSASRNTVGNRLLQNRLTRLQTTTVRNVVPILRHSDEEDDLNKKTQPVKSDDGQVQPNSRKPVFGNQSRIRTTTTARNPISRDSDEDVDSVNSTTAATTRSPASRIRFNRIQATTTTTVRSDSIEQVEDLSSKSTTVRSLPSGNRFGRFRTTTVSTPTTTTEDSKEQEDAIKTTTTVRNSLSGNRFNRVRTTTARTTTTTSDSSEQDGLVTLVSTTQPTTVRGSLSGNRFGRFRATTTTSSTTVSKDSDEQVESVTPAPSTTTARSLLRNRFSSFRGTTTSPPVTRDSDEEIEKVNATQTTTSRIFVPGNRFSRLRVTKISTSTSTSNSDEEIDSTTPMSTTTTRNLRPGNRFSSRPRSTTTVATTTVSNDSDERDDSVNGTTTTSRSISPGNRFNRFRPTTTVAPTTTLDSKSSDEQDDSITSSTTVRNSLLRNKFIRTTTVRIPTTTAEDSTEQEDMVNATQKTNSTSADRVGRIRVTTVSSIKSSDSGEQSELVNGTVTTTVRNVDSEEKMDLVNSTQEATTSRSSIFLKYFNRYRTTKSSHPNSDSSDEERVKLANQTSAQVENPVSRQNFLNRLRSAVAAIPTASNLTAPATAPLETSNLGRKDRAIIYSSAKSDNQLITSTVSTVQVETTQSTSSVLAPVAPPPGYYTFGSSDEIDDTSEDDDASRAPYFDPYYGVHLRETSAGASLKVPMEENSLEVDDVSSEMELNVNVTAKPDENSSEITMADRVPAKVTDVQHVYLHPNIQDDVSVEVVITVPNHPHQDVQNQTGMTQHAFNFGTAESDEGNDGSVEEKEGSGDALEENQNDRNSTTAVQEQSTNPVKESDEGNDASKEKEALSDVPDENLGGNNTTNTTRVDEVSPNSDENEENSSLEIDLSKLTDIQRALTDVKTEEVIIPDVMPELQRFFTDIKPVELILEDRNQTTTMAPVPVTKSQSEGVIRPTPSNDEVTMKLKELLTNPVVQQRLEAIDGRLKSTKSARVKRLIEKYLAALAKLSSNSASASTSFSVFLPLLITCLLFGFS